MQNNVEPDFQSQLDAVFAQLDPQAVEEFYTAYQQWSLHQRKNELRQRIEMVRAQQAENEQRLREAQPSAIAFAALARLQSNGVSDTALLDAMLERGESWLDKTMQRLDYFEQFDDFISDDYTKWCQGALEGAFDWIDSLREGVEQATPEQIETLPEQSPTDSEEAAEVEALLLQRLATEHEEDDLEWQEAITLKQPAIRPQEPETTTGEAVKQELPAPADAAQQHEETQAQTTEYVPQDEQATESSEQAAEYIPQDEPGQHDEKAITPDAAVPPGAEEQVLPEEASPLEESALAAAEPDQPALIEFAPLEETAPDEEASHPTDEEPPLIESVPVDEPPAARDELHIGDEEPAFVESAPTDESPAGEDTMYAVDEEPTLVEFAALSPSEVSPVSPPEETVGQEAEQAELVEVSQEEETSEQETEPAAPSEVLAPEDVPVHEEEVHGEANEPGEPQETEQDKPEDVPAHEQAAHDEANAPDEPQEMEQHAPADLAPRDEETPPSNQASQPIRGTPRKAGLMRRLARFFAGS